MYKKIAVFLSCFLIVSGYSLVAREVLGAYDFTGEKITYSISPAGVAEYNDLGVVDLGGRKAKLVTFRTRVFGFDDTERIYSDPGTLLPIRVERDIAWFGRENIVEEYGQEDFSVTIKKYKGKKKISEKTLKKGGAIQNAILLPFYVRAVQDLYVGWQLDVRVPAAFKVTLASIDEIKIMGKKFSAYHFTSVPAKFEIWISKDPLRIPLKIRGKDGFNYTLQMKSYSLPGKK